MTLKQLEKELVEIKEKVHNIEIKILETKIEMKDEIHHEAEIGEKKEASDEKKGLPGWVKIVGFIIPILVSSGLIGKCGFDNIIMKTPSGMKRFQMVDTIKDGITNKTLVIDNRVFTNRRSK